MLGAEEYGNRHGFAGRHGLASWCGSWPFQHLPGGRLHAGSENCAPSSRATPEKVVNLIQLHRRGGARDFGPARLIARCSRIVGRSDLLRQVSPRWRAYLGTDLDLNPLAEPWPRWWPRSGGTARSRAATRCPTRLGRQIESATAQPLFTHREKDAAAYSVRNTHRAVGTRLLCHDHAQVRHGGAAARDTVDRAPARHRRPVARRLRRARHQARSARRCQRTMFGKGLSGGTIVVKPTVSSKLVPGTTPSSATRSSTAPTAGKLFASGERRRALRRPELRRRHRRRGAWAPTAANT